MSVNFLPILVDEKVLTDKIQQTLPPEQIDEAIQEAWRNDALPRNKSENRFAFREFSEFDNTRFWFEAAKIRLQILFAAWQLQYTDKGSVELEKSADALYQFLGSFHCGYANNNGVNDYGLVRSCAIRPVNSRRLHELFKRID